MDNIRKIKYFLTCLLAVGLMSCSNDNDDITTGYEGFLMTSQEEVNVQYKNCGARLHLLLTQNEPEL